MTTKRQIQTSVHTDSKTILRHAPEAYRSTGSSLFGHWALASTLLLPCSGWKGKRQSVGRGEQALTELLHSQMRTHTATVETPVASYNCLHKIPTLDFGAVLLSWGCLGKNKQGLIPII